MQALFDQRLLVYYITTKTTNKLKFIHYYHVKLKSQLIGDPNTCFVKFNTFIHYHGIDQLDQLNLWPVSLK